MPIPNIQGQAGVLDEPSLRFTGSGKAVLNVRVAFNDSKFNEQTRQWENTRSFFVDCTAWEQTAERLAETIRKGDQVYVEGRLETEQWEKDGQKRSKPNLIVRTMRPFAKGQQQSGGGFQNGVGWHEAQPQDKPDWAPQAGNNWQSQPQTAQSPWSGSQHSAFPQMTQQNDAPPPF